MTNYNKFSYVYSKVRREFGKQPLFQDVRPYLLDSISPDKQEQRLFIARNPVHRSVQATLPQSEHDTNTKHLITHEQGINHTEGGWPRDVQSGNEEHVSRHCRRVQHEENYINAMFNLAQPMTHSIDQNNAINMYQTYFDGIPQQPAVEKYNIRIANIFKDTLNRPISCITWTDENRPKIAVAYSFKCYPRTNDLNTGNRCFLWDIHHEDKPSDILEPSSPCWQLACSPADPEILAAGLEDGTVSVFDVRCDVRPVSNSSPYNSHREPITSLLYLHTRNNSEFFTGSSDGQCLWWDTRNLSQPTDQLSISINLAQNEKPNLGNAEGISCLQYDRNLPTRFMCGTESGLVINANRMGRDHSEILSCSWDAHVGSVKSVHRSPCTLRMFLTCGDFTVRIWSEEVRTAPIIDTEPYRYQLQDVCWAPQRYSCYMSACSGGYFYYWDLLRKYREPVATLKVSEHSLTKFQPRPNGRSVAVGDQNGSIFLLKLSEVMAVPDNINKVNTNLTYYRETRREHILDNRVKEIRLKMKIEEETEVVVHEEIDEEELEKNAEEDYWKIIRNVKEKEGLLTPSITSSINI